MPVSTSLFYLQVLVLGTLLSSAIAVNASTLVTEEYLSFISLRKQLRYMQWRERKKAKRLAREAKLPAPSLCIILKLIKSSTCPLKEKGGGTLRKEKEKKRSNWKEKASKKATNKSSAQVSKVYKALDKGIVVALLTT
jgi:hypothetical protein